MTGNGPFRLKELVAIGVGGMIGGGIFSVMGLAVDISGNGAPLAFLLGGLLALVAGHSYIALAVSFRSDGSSFTFLEYAFPRHPVVAAFSGWVVVIGYVGTMALYAFTFGAYGAELLGSPDSNPVREMLSVGSILVFTAINLYGAKLSGHTEDLIVFGKLILMALLGAACMGSVDVHRMTPVVDKGGASVFMAAALIFVAYEGFQLITNSVCETEHPERDVRRGIYISIALVTAVYLFLSIIAIGALPRADLLAAKEYAMAVAAEPALGKAGRVLVCVAALMATASAINATLFGASRLTLEMARENEMPGAFSFRNRGDVPYLAVITLSVLSVALTWHGGLTFIATFSSTTFLLVSLGVTVANFRLRMKTRSSGMVSAAGSLLIVCALDALAWYLYQHDPATLWQLVGTYAAVAVAEGVFRIFVRRKREA